MTENKTQKWLERFEWDDSEETSEALATICEALQEYPKFKAIGTVEEFKALKEKKHIGSENMVISSSDLMTILNSDSEENKEGYKHGYSDGYAKGIDEFAERLKGKAEEILKNPDIVAECKKCTIWTVKDIDEIAEQLKKGWD